MAEEQTEPKGPTVNATETGGFENSPQQDAETKRKGVPSGSPETPVPERRGVPSGAPEDTSRLAALETALNEARQSLDARAGDCDRLKAALDDAVSAYRKLAVSASPLYSDDIISGSSVEEIDTSIKKINGLVKKMRSSLEAELKDLTIPAGAPERSAPDTSGLSPREKIKQGLDRK